MHPAPQRRQQFSRSLLENKQHLIEAIGPDEITRLRQQSLHLDLQTLIELASTRPTS
jgi:hypothetical protein